MYLEFAMPKYTHNSLPFQTISLLEISDKRIAGNKKDRRIYQQKDKTIEKISRPQTTP